MKNLTWLASRLSKMSSAEVIYRIRHKLLEKYDEHTLARQSFVLPLTSHLSADFPFSLSQHIKVEDFTPLHHSSLSCLLESADLYLDNNVNVFGTPHAFGKEIDWHVDPKSGKRWPREFWGKVNIRDGFSYGGPKFVWETNRLYGLPVLSLAYQATNEEKYGDKFFSLLTEWLKGNPYPYGVNWTSGIELGVRIAKLVWGV